MQRVLILAGFVIVGLLGLVEPPDKPDAIQVSDANPASGLWTSGKLVNVAARRTRHRRRVVVRRRKLAIQPRSSAAARPVAPPLGHWQVAARVQRLVRWQAEERATSTIERHTRNE